MVHLLDYKVKLDGSILGNVDHYKYLGVILDSTLNFTKRSIQPKYVDNRNLLTRAHDKILVLCPRPRTERFKNSFVYTTAKCWNELSLDEQRASSCNSFKLKTKKREFEKLLST